MFEFITEKFYKGNGFIWLDKNFQRWEEKFKFNTIIQRDEEK